jgi:hypothetical protein
MSEKQDDLAQDKPSVNPYDNAHHGKGDTAAGEHIKSASNQNLNQSDLTEQGNQTKGSTPGSNPQGNRPMSVDTNSPKKGPGSHAD